MKEFKDLHITEDWGATIYVNHWAETMRPLIGQPNLLYVEIGAWQGLSLWCIFQKIMTHPTCHAVVIDPFTENPAFMNGMYGDYYERFQYNLSDYWNQIRIFRGLSQDSAGYLREQVDLLSVDMCYIDGDHSRPACLHDAELLLPYLKPGGFMIFDDARSEGPIEAIAEFRSSHSEMGVAFAEGPQVILRKTEGTP